MLGMALDTIKINWHSHVASANFCAIMEAEKEIENVIKTIER